MSRAFDRLRSALLFVAASAMLTTACGGAATVRADREPGDADISALWHDLRSDVVEGRAGALQERAHQLAVLQQERCRQLRASVAIESESDGSDGAPGTLVRCEDALREFETIARLSGFRSSGSPR